VYIVVVHFKARTSWGMYLICMHLIGVYFMGYISWACIL
jgi:hypothetical protein